MKITKNKIMRNYKSYRSKVLDLFQSFLAQKVNKEELLTTLDAIERNLKQGRITEKGIWFRFYNGYGLATTISDIRSYLHNSNEESLKEDMQIAINEPKGFRIHYS